MFKGHYVTIWLMTSKIAIALVAVLVIAIIVPTAYAQKLPQENKFYSNCEVRLSDDLWKFGDFSCIVDIYKMWYDIVSLFDRVGVLEANQNQTSLSAAESINTRLDDITYRLDIADGKIQPPYIDLSVSVYPNDTIIGKEKFDIRGTADRIEQYWVDFVFFNPDGISVQSESTNILPNNVYFTDVIRPNNNWNLNGTYTVQVTHGPHIENATIQYTTGENP